MKLLHFIDGTGGTSATGNDEHVFPADRLTAIQIEDADEVRLWFSNSDGQTNDHRIDLQVDTANKAEELADYFANLCASPSGSIGHSGIYSFAITDTVGEGATINDIAYTIGS